jgi:hypothetical protein
MSYPGLQDKPESLSLGAYRIERDLVPGRTWLGRGENARLVVLKSLPQECLLNDQLHPDIRDRLERIQQLAHMGVANLYGVERDGERVFAVWEYVEGVTLQEYLRQRHGTAPRQMAHELVSSVQSLHALGLSHGLLHARNVIVTPSGGLRITHLSPLLYSQPDVDIQGLLDTLPEFGCREEIADLDCNSPLRQLSLRVLAWSRQSHSPEGNVVEPGARRHWSERNTALAAALLLAAAAAVVSWGIVTRANRQDRSDQLQEPVPAPKAEVQGARPAAAMGSPGTNGRAAERQTRMHNASNAVEALIARRDAVRAGPGGV